ARPRPFGRGGRGDKERRARGDKELASAQALAGRGIKASAGGGRSLSGSAGSFATEGGKRWRGNKQM
ncbi:MAG: hypothetical protein AAF471_08235, partial [Myxococcota bacterium]